MGAENEQIEKIVVQVGDCFDIDGMEMRDFLQLEKEFAWRMKQGSWIAFRVSLPKTGRYRVSYRVGSPQGMGGLLLEAYGGHVIFGRVMSFPSTRSIKNFQSVSHDVNLPWSWISYSSNFVYNLIEKSKQ